MDKIDIILSLLLMQNSRQTYRELAKICQLSVNAVHKRIQALIDTGIIRAFVTKISLYALNIIWVLVFGDSEKGSQDEVREKLGNHENIHWVVNGGGKSLYIGLYLRDISELDSCISFIKEVAKIENQRIGIINYTGNNPPSNLKFSQLDYEILYSLRNNSRKSIMDVASELGIAAKTVRRHLENMVENKMVEFSIEWYPDAANDINSIFHVELDQSTNKEEMVSNLLQKYFPNVMYCWAFSTLPNLLLVGVWTPTIAEVEKMRENVQKMGVKSVLPNVLYHGKLYNTWRDKLLEEKANPSRHV